MRLQERLKDLRLQEEIWRILSKICAYEGTETISSPIPILVYSTSDPQLWEAAVRYQEQVGGRVRFPLLYLKVDNESGKVVDVGKYWDDRHGVGEPRGRFKSFKWFADKHKMFTAEAETASSTKSTAQLQQHSYSEEEDLTMYKSHQQLQVSEEKDTTIEENSEKKWHAHTEIEDDENVLSKSPVEVDPCAIGQFQHFKEMNSLREECVTPNPKNVDSSSKISSQQGHAKLAAGSSSVYIMASRFSHYKAVGYHEYADLINRINKGVQLYSNSMQELSQKGTGGLSEAFVAFRNYFVEKDVFEEIDYKFGEILHHCSRTVGIRKIYHHYNFTVEMKNDKDCWIPRVYFAEVKMKYGFKYRFCAPLEATDDGQCYSCKNQGIDKLKHPSRGGYSKGYDGAVCNHLGEDSSDEEDELM
ncbi:hypothetical protein OsJ_35224 [Oryza sativa Japonica Group]|uniref:DUF3615 domain-containing protein n=1 Tax=Oryza sativa subsp. japonica TaxID=39947 RepID=B9GBW5_ORYSJ|nr:hypothetical protein OsJ_35224 [Oryza sativa Japonica Group]